MRYDVFGEKRSVQYTVKENGSANFKFVSQKGTAKPTHLVNGVVVEAVVAMRNLRPLRIVHRVAVRRMVDDAKVVAVPQLFARIKDPDDNDILLSERPVDGPY